MFQDHEDSDLDHKMNHLSPNSFIKSNKKHLIHQKSAPGTPISPKRFNLTKTPSRTPSDESSSVSASGELTLEKQKVVVFWPYLLKLLYSGRSSDPWQRLIYCSQFELSCKLLTQSILDDCPTILFSKIMFFLSIVSFK